MTDFVNRGDVDADARDGETQAPQSRLQEATQVAQAIVTEELEAPPGQDTAAEAAEQPEVVAENEVQVDKPAPGETERVAAEAGQIYVMNFDPNLAQVLIQGQDFVLLFADGSQIVFQNLVGLAAQGLAPFLRVGGLNIGGDIILAQARALADEQDDQGLPTLETAAGPTGPQGSGGTQYDDDFGSLISVLDAEGPIPFTVLPNRTFGSDIEPIDDVVPTIAPPTGTLLVNPGGPAVAGIFVVPPEGIPPGGTPPDDVPPEFPPGSDPRAFGEGAAASFLSEDITSFALLTAQATEGVLIEIVLRDLPTPGDGWTVTTDALVNAVSNAGGSVDLSNVDQGTITITFPTGAGVTSFQAPLGLTPPTNSDVDFPGVDVIVTAQDPAGGDPVSGGTLDILIPVDAVVDGTEVLVAGQVIPAGAFLVGDLNNIITDLQLTIDPFDQTSIAGAAPDADAAFTQGQGDVFDGSEQVTQLVVTLSIVDPILGLPILNFTLPSGISASGPSADGTSTTTTFTVDQGTSFAAVQALVDSFTVSRPDPTFFGTIQVGIETTTVETDPNGLEPNPDNNVDVDSYAFAVTFTPQPNAQFVIENVLGVIPEDTQTGIQIQANIPGNCVDVVVTEILVTGLPTSASGWTFDLSEIEAFVAGLSGTNSIEFDPDAGTLRLTFDIAASVDDFSQAILALPPANSDVDILDLSVTATATNIVSGETTDADPFVDDVIVDAVVDGSEVSQLSPAIAASGTTDPVSLGLALTLGGDSTVGGDPGTSPPDFEAQGGTDVDGSESVTSLEIVLTPDDPLGVPELDWDTSIIADTSPLVTVSTRGTDGSITYLFDTSGLTQAQVETLVGSFGVVVAASFAGTVGVLVESTLAEVATAADGGSIPNDSEVFDDDNVDVDQYEFQVVYRDTPNGNLTVLGQGGAFFPEDTQTPAQVSATVADPTAGDVITEIRIEQLPTTADGWTIDVSPLQAAVTALGGTLVFDAAAGIITITFDTADNITDLVAQATTAGESANILMTPPVNSDEDFPGVDVIVTATDVPTGFTLTGGTDDITLVVDAIVDGTEVQQGGANIPTAAEIANTGVSTDLDLSITNLQDSTSLTGATNPDPDAPFTQGGGDADNSETVTQVVVALSVATGAGGLPSLGFTLPAGITVDDANGVTVGNTVTYTFTIPDATVIGDVNSLLDSFSVEVPNAAFAEDVSVDITTTTTETAENGAEPNAADNQDVDSYSLTVSFAGTPNGNLNVLGQGGAFIPEDTETPAQLSATVADPTSDEVLTEIRIEQLPTPTDGWAIDVSPLQAAVTALGGTLVYDAAAGTITITFQVADGVTDLVADAAALVPAQLANILLTPPTNSDEDFPGVDVIVTATDSSSGATATGETLDITLVVDAIVDGTEVQQGGANIPTAAEIANTGVSTDLDLSITNLQDSTSLTGATNPDPNAPFTQGGGDADGSETVTQVVVALSVATGAGGLPSLGFTLPAGITVDDANGVTVGNTVTYTFTIPDGTVIGDVSSLLDSFSVEVPSADFAEDVSVDITTTTTETAENGLEPNAADNQDVDEYSLTVSFAGTPNGNLNVLGQGGAFIPEDTETPAQLSATVADPTSDEVLTEIRIEQLPTPTDGWAIDVSPLQAAVTALGGTLVYDAAAGTITITFQVADGVTDLVADAAALVPAQLANILLTPPTNSDADFPGVDVIVTATDSSSGATATGGTDDITLVVDAIVDGTEVVGNDRTEQGSRANGNDIPLTNLGLSINLLDQTSQVAIPDTDAPFTQGGADDDGSETVTQIVVTLTPDNLTVGLPVLGFTLPTGITVDAVDGVTSGTGDSIAWTFTIADGTDISVVDQLVQSLAVDPPANFSGDIDIGVETTTTETGLPTSGAEPNTADNTDVDTYEFTLTVDPVPLPEDDPVDVNEAPNVNLTFVIDHSSSMEDSSGVAVTDVTLPGSITDPTAFLGSSDNTVDGNGVTFTRLGLLKVALVELLEAYAAAGTEVNVLLVQFDEIGEVISDGNVDDGNWFDNDLGSVIDAILAIEIGFGTNYTDALETARDEFPIGTPASDQNILYFLSDGQPTRGGNPGDNSIPDADIALWEAFLSDNLMPAIAVGIGQGVLAADSDLEDVAVPNDPFDNNPLIVLDEDDLIPTLVETVSNRVSGNVLANDDFGPDGQGTPAITQIVVDGVTFTFDGTNITNQATSAVISGSVLAVLTALGGQFEFDFSNGDFSYIAPEVDADQTETFTYRIQDADGDANDANLVITVNDQTQAATANADSVITNDTDNLIEIADAWLVFNDSDPQGDALGVATVSGLGATGGFSEVATDFLFTGGNTIGQFSYQAHDFIQLSNAATVNLSLEAGATLDGSAAGEILIGSASADVINGLGGADVLAGNAGSDILDGGAGNDLLIGGIGADQITGGTGSDIFQITAAEFGTGIDSFVDINLTDDRVNLGQLLTEFDSSQDISEFVQLTAATGELAVDQDGGGDSFAAVAAFATTVTAGETLTVISDPDGNEATVTAV